MIQPNFSYSQPPNYYFRIRFDNGGFISGQNVKGIHEILDMVKANGNTVTELFVTEMKNYSMLGEEKPS
jgi:hypothetical protein